MADKRYNGWTNYETWNVALWMGNEEGGSRHYDELAQTIWNDARADGTFTREENAISAMASNLKEDYEQAMHDLLEQSRASASVWADLLGAALSEVDWHEIAEHYIGEVDQSEAEEVEEDCEA